MHLRLWLIILVLSYILTGCAGSFTGTQPETCRVTVPYAQSQAYTQASQVYRQMGGQMTGGDGHQTISGLIRGAAVLNVQLEAEGTHATVVTATGNITPGKIMLENVPTAQAFCTRMRAVEVRYAP